MCLLRVSRLKRTVLKSFLTASVLLQNRGCYLTNGQIFLHSCGPVKNFREKSTQDQPSQACLLSSKHRPSQSSIDAAAKVLIMLRIRLTGIKPRLWPWSNREKRAKPVMSREVSACPATSKQKSRRLAFGEYNSCVNNHLPVNKSLQHLTKKQPRLSVKPSQKLSRDK